MKPINTSIFDFPTLLAKGCVYVDKTAQIHELAKPSADGNDEFALLKIPNHEDRQALETGCMSRLLGKARSCPPTTSASTTIPPPTSARSTT